MRIRSYEVFKGCMEVACHSNFYYTLYRNTYTECTKRLSLLETFEPENYHKWLKRWKAER